MSASSPDSGPYLEAAGHARMMPSTPDRSGKAPQSLRSARYSEWRTVRELLAELQRLPRDGARGMRVAGVGGAPIPVLGFASPLSTPQPRSQGQDRMRVARAGGAPVPLLGFLILPTTL